MADLQNAENVAKANALNPWTIRRLGAAGEITVYRHGTAVRYDPDEVRAYMRSQGQAHPTLPRPRAKGK